LICSDPVYNKFGRTLSHAPAQILRYDYNGTPLWASKVEQPTTEDIASGADGTPRIFELQVMPPILHHLKVEEKAGVKDVMELKAGANQKSTLDFGTIAIYTSQGGEPGEYVEEVAWLQPYSKNNNSYDLPPNPALEAPIEDAPALD